MKHTSLPWRSSGPHTREIYDPHSGHTICCAPVADAFPSVKWEENVEFIIRACNSHYDMLEALKYVVKYHRENDSGEGELYGLDYVTTCIAAIRKAEER